MVSYLYLSALKIQSLLSRKLLLSEEMKAIVVTTIYEIEPERDVGRTVEPQVPN